MEKHRKSKKQEQRITMDLNSIRERARMTPGSGSKWHSKSDVVTDRFRIEAKTKEKPSKSITLKKEWLDKIGIEAFETGKTPVLAFSFGDGRDYYVLEKNDFLAMAGGVE